MAKSLKTPLILLIFNRPEHSSRLFEIIHHVRPAKLFVVADGPRNNKPGEKEKCESARSVIQKIDWECEVKTNFSDINMGCKDRVSSGISWVFSQVEEAIILEDDCMPDVTFFLFCSELLDRYRDDSRVMAISGDNFQLGKKRTEFSYYFSRYPHCWGWATWKRAWKYYDHEMTIWPYIRDNGWLQAIFDKKSESDFWRHYLQAFYDDGINSWAARWTFACWIQSGLTILPNVNLVSNIGFDALATHTKDERNRQAFLPTEKMVFPLKHPPFVLRDNVADDFTQKQVFTPGKIASLRRLMGRILGR